MKEVKNMATNKYYPIRIRDEKERETLDLYLKLCKDNSSDGSSEIRKFMKRYIARYSANPEESSKKIKNAKTSNVSTEVKGNYPSVKDYLDKIGYTPSYVKPKK